MKMKKIVYIMILFAGVVITSSCSKDFLETKPTDAYPDYNILADEVGLTGAINGMHKNMYRQYDSQGQSGVGSINILNEALGEDVVWPNRGNGWFEGSYRWNDHRNKTADMANYPYRFFYQLISNANMILANLDDASGDPAALEKIKGQALIYRAYCYFNLVQLYGKRYSSTSATDLGVPLLLEPTYEPQPRVTVAEVYAQVEKDLNAAITLLTGWTRPNKSHLDVSVAEGIYAQVALTKGEWASAKSHAIAARTASAAKGGVLAGAEELASGYKDYTAKEWMWGSHVIDDQTLYFYAFSAYMSMNFNSTNIRQAPKLINSALFDMIPATDLRKNFWEPNPTKANFPLPGDTAEANTAFARFPYMNRKFKVDDPGSSVADVIIMRLAEMYLIQAEAEARLGETANAQNTLFDLVKTRDAGYTKSTNTGQALIDEILIQRRIELWGEGRRFLDLKRLNLPLDRTIVPNISASVYVVMSVPAGDDKWQYLFSKTEEDTNPFIKDNPNP